MPIALITHPACLEHDPGPYHPECPDRLRAVLRALEGRGVLRRCCASRRREATVEQLARVHPPDYVEAHPGDPARPPGESVPLDADTVDVRRQRGGGAARGGRRGRRGRCGDGGLGARGLRRDPPARPSRRAARADGVLPVRQRRRRGRARPRALGPAARRGGRFRRASRQRHAGHVREPTPTCSTAPAISSPAIPAPARPARRGIAGNVVNVPLPPGRRQRGVPHAPGRACMLPALDRIRARAADRLGRVRRAQGRPAGAAAAGDGGFRLADRASCSTSPAPAAAAGWSRCWRAATIWRRWPRRPPRMCRCLMQA